MPVPATDAALAGGTEGPRALRPLVDTVLDALTTGAEDRAGPLPAGGPDAVAPAVRAACAPLLADDGTGPHDALRTLVHTLAAGAADPADPHCAAHLHCPPLALAAAAELAACALNPSMDSWDQAPAASAIEALTTRELAALVYPYARTTAPARAAAPHTQAQPGPAPTAPHPDPATPRLTIPAPTAAPDNAPDATPALIGPVPSIPPGTLNTARTPSPLRTPGSSTAPAAPLASADPGTVIPAGGPDALVTTGGTESNQLAVLLAREAARATAHSARETTAVTTGGADSGTGGEPRREAARIAAAPPEPTAPLRIVCGANAHHSIHRAAWLLGLPAPITLPTPNGVLHPDTVHAALSRLDGPALLTATAGTTDSGAIDPLPALADLAEHHGARFHVDAAYGGALLFSDTHRALLNGLDRAHTVTLDLHKLGWQPVAAGLLAVPGSADLAPLDHRADYLNADDDTEAGLPDLLGRSLRTTRRPDILKIAVTLKALGRRGIGDLVDRTLAAARTLADLVEARPDLELHSRPTLTTVLFRPTGADDTTLAAIRRSLLTDGHAVLGRATTATGLWLKATLLNPHTQPGDLENLLKLVEGHIPR
ncbi:pyridoxal-dependent decarboxylase [Streptomyces pinistramenti]|uniref:pyridoxal-dependent decarboxylase n=1 Tax=Streptomyces pinistramenti TaxID=2884812 RepID=UPI001D07D1B0|nr:pyridoxal-dependent decarboxylase [Streptomyces pinistramenti]MCB5911797.1 aspartate aminotransferase family protein [Streptomyces pinistramenti]